MNTAVSLRFFTTITLLLTVLTMGCQTIDYAPDTAPTKAEQLARLYVQENEVELSKEFGIFILSHEDVPEHITGNWLADHMTTAPETLWSIRQAHVYSDFAHWIQASMSASFDDGSTAIDARLVFDLDVNPELEYVNGVKVALVGNSVTVTTTGDQ